MLAPRISKRYLDTPGLASFRMKNAEIKNHINYLNDVKYNHFFDQSNRYTELCKYKAYLNIY